MGWESIISLFHNFSLLGVHHHFRIDFIELNEEENWSQRQNFAEKVPISLQNICRYYQQPEWENKEPWTLRTSDAWC